jgi:hypothetical protein
MELVALVKHDCPVCDQVLPALDAAGVRVLSQSSAEETAAQAARLELTRVPELDLDLSFSERLDPDAVPALVLLDGTREQGRVEGLQKRLLEELAARGGAALDLDGLPEHRPGCAARNRDPDVAARLAARRARREGRLTSREIEIGELEDVHEALHARGVTDGLPVVPPTPERVMGMLEGTSRDPQDLVATLPPYDGKATVEKVAINAVMAGCAPEHLPVVLAAVAAAAQPQFALHGLVATTHPAGPAIIAFDTDVGINDAGNCLGQGARANSAIGRALQLTVRNVGGGRPRVEDRAAHGQPGKVGLCFAERAEHNPWPSPYDTPTVLLMALEAPRILVDQLARDPEGLAASLALALESGAPPNHPHAVVALGRPSTPFSSSAPSTPASSARRAGRASSSSSASSSSPRAPPRSSCAARGARPRASRSASSATPRCRWPSSPPPTASASSMRAATPACSAWSSARGRPARSAQRR